MTVEQGEKPLYIGGEWQTASGEVIDVTNPADESLITQIASADAADVARAFDAAEAAYPGWRRLSPIQRGNQLRKLVDACERSREHLASLLTLEVGKPLTQAKAEVEFAISILRYSCEWDRRIEGEILPGDSEGETIHLLRAPLGVVAAICPWNFPLAVLFRKLGPALLTGNTIVVKPSEETPLTALEVFRMIDQHLELPAGVANLVTGAGATGAAMVDEPRAAMVTFTGHRDTGKAIMASAADRLTRVALELGGKAPAIVWRDADLDIAVPSILAARHTNSGQVCTSAERVLVHADILDEFQERYVAAVEGLRIGNPIGEVDMGPMVSAKQLDKTRAALDLAIREGAEVIAGGGELDGDEYEKGYWQQPAVLGGIKTEMSIMHEETFGPITPILAVDSIEEAVSISNDSRYGLSAYLFSRDYRTVMETVDDLHFGEIYINRSLGESVHAHHSGYGESGIGGEDGKWGILRYTQIKTAYHHFG